MDLFGYGVILGCHVMRQVLVQLPRKLSDLILFH